MTSEEGSKPFTSFARAYAEGGEPTSKQLDEVWDALRYRLYWALRSRSMWNQPPIFLGVDRERWVSLKSSQGVPPTSKMRDSLDELTQMAFADVLLGEKLKHFIRYVLNGREVEGVVRCALEQFLSDRQRFRDPLGYEVYRLLKAAADEGIQRGELRTAEGESSVVSSTILVFEGGSSEDEPSPNAVKTPAHRWNETLFADWMTVWGERKVRMAEKTLVERLKELPREGIFVVRFGDLVNAVKHDVKVRASEDFAGWGPGPVRRSDGNPKIAEDADRRWRRWMESEESVERFRALSECVEQWIDRMPGQRRTREAAGRLWNLLKNWALSSPEAPLDLDARAWEELLDAEQLSRRKIGRYLKKHHDRIGDLLDRLKPRIRDCLETVGSRKPRTSGNAGNLGSDAPTQEPTMDEDLDFRQQLLAQARLAARTEEKESLPPAVKGSRVGELLFLGENRALAVEWLILDEKAARLLLVPVDSQSWVGPNDAPLPDDSLTARLGLGWWIDAHDLPEATGPRVDISELIEIHRRVINDTCEIGNSLWEVASDPDYRSWIRTVDSDRRTLCEELNGELDGSLDEEAAPPRLQLSEPPIPTSIVDAREKRRVEPQDPVYRPMRGWKLAAVLVLTASSSLIGGMAYQQMRVHPVLVESEAERHRLETQNQKLNERLEAQQELTQAELDALRAEAEADRKALEVRLEEVTTSYEGQLARLDQPEMVVRSIFVPEGIQRSDPEELPVSQSDRSVLLEVEAREGDSLRIVEWPGEKKIFETTVAGLPEGRNLPLRLPTRLLSAGEYRVYVERDGRQVTLFRFSIEMRVTP